ncbi:hypothetical protein [Polymorphospora sp. NPDC050346]|uniref:hypothetical protein n=1 Tax=Polymorphospora sp. NPDC050346 TaxID=3155780 RepID=UPI0033CE6DED
MTGRLLLLHLRARGGPAFAAGLVVVTALAWAGGSWLISRPYFDGPAARIPVVALTPLLGALLLAPTLAGAGDELERGTPAPWRHWRAGHVLAAVVVIGTPLALTGLHAPEVFGAYALLRNTLGCVGLVAGAAVLLGARLAWLPAFGYVCAVYGAVPRQVGGAAGIWAWPVQPSGVEASWAVAVALFVAGSASYLWYGARPRFGGD